MTLQSQPCPPPTGLLERKLRPPSHGGRSAEASPPQRGVRQGDESHPFPPHRCHRAKARDVKRENQGLTDAGKGEACVQRTKHRGRSARRSDSSRLAGQGTEPDTRGQAWAQQGRGARAGPHPTRGPRPTPHAVTPRAHSADGAPTIPGGR